jgi:hypothetical protein
MEQDISSRRGAARRVQALPLGTEGSANLLTAKKVGIDAGGSVARPESTIVNEEPLYLRGTLAQKIEYGNGRNYRNPVTYKRARSRGRSLIK